LKPITLSKISARCRAGLAGGLLVKAVHGEEVSVPEEAARPSSSGFSVVKKKSAAATMQTER
jgi:hypothetical protein